MGVVESERSTPVSLDKTTEHSKKAFESEPYIYQPYIHHVIPEMQDECDGHVHDDDKKNFEMMMKMIDVANHEEEGGAKDKLGPGDKGAYEAMTQMIMLAKHDPFPETYGKPDEVDYGPSTAGTSVPPYVTEAGDWGGDGDQGTRRTAASAGASAGVSTGTSAGTRVLEIKKDDKRRPTPGQDGSCISKCCTVL